MLRRLAARLRSRPADGQSLLPVGETVADYYELATDTYLSATGDFIQAFRTADTDALMRYLTDSIGIADGMRILDAGCGVGAPAIWLAQHFPALRVAGVTISQRQADIAQERIATAGVDDRVTVAQGDFHALGYDFAAASFDRAVFIESLGHHQGLQRVLSGAAQVLKPGGALYIKDFFRRTSPDAPVQSAIDAAIDTINRNYVYDVMDLSELIAAIRGSGFTLRYARQPDIVPDLGLTVAFEHAIGRLTYPTFSNVHAVDWFELLAVRD